jgi:hypothetical protein
MLFTLLYLASVVYCLYQLSKGTSKRNSIGNIGDTPALDTLMVLILAPFLAIMDILISIVNFFKRNLWI